MKEATFSIKVSLNLVFRVIIIRISVVVLAFALQTLAYAVLGCGQADMNFLFPAV